MYVVDAMDHFFVSLSGVQSVDRAQSTKITYSCNAVVDQPMLSMAFWFKAWNDVIPGSYTVPQISKALFCPLPAWL
jgi:hypothetical protein